MLLDATKRVGFRAKANLYFEDFADEIEKKACSNNFLTVLHVQGGWG